jgi:hypothetical protein
LVFPSIDPANPSVVGSLPWSFLDSLVDGSYAFFAVYGGLRIMNVSDPASPTQAGFFDVPSRNFEYLAKAGRYVYLAEQGDWDGNQYTDGGLWIIDVNAISSPQQVGYLGMAGDVLDIAMTRDHVYMVYREEGLRIVNVSDPADPQQIGALASEEFYQAVAAAGQYVYWGDGWDYDLRIGLRILDIADPAHPVEIGSVDTKCPPERMTVVGNSVYVDNGSGVVVVDVSDPANPATIAWHGTVGGSSTNGMAVAGNRIYTTYYGAGVFILRPVRAWTLMFFIAADNDWLQERDLSPIIRK